MLVFKLNVIFPIRVFPELTNLNPIIYGALWCTFEWVSEKLISALFFSK